MSFIAICLTLPFWRRSTRRLRPCAGGIYAAKVGTGLLSMPVWPPVAATRAAVDTRRACVWARLALAALSVLLLLALAAPVRAQDLVIPGRSAGEAGMQLDVALVSPQPAQVHTEGVVLSVLPGGVERVRLWPWPPVQGQTLTVWLHTREPVSATLALSGQSYPVISEGRFSWAMLPLPPLAAAGSKPMTLTVGGQAMLFRVPVQAGSFEVDDIPATVSQPILSETSRVASELERLTALFASLSPVRWTPSSRFQLPLAGSYPRTSPFGSRRTYGGGAPVSAHTGEDYAAPPGTPVLAPAAGQVLLAEELFVRGNAIVLDHGGGVYTGYWHLRDLSVQLGASVVPGQMLGTVGSTGLSTGAHLHWEMRLYGVPVDPLQWVDRD